MLYLSNESSYDFYLGEVPWCDSWVDDSCAFLQQSKAKIYPCVLQEARQRGEPGTMFRVNNVKWLTDIQSATHTLRKQDWFIQDVGYCMRF